jgi:hypothetical protein
MPQQCDLGNICQMFKGSFKTILVALQDGNTAKAVDACVAALKALDRLEDRDGDDCT